MGNCCSSSSDENFKGSGRELGSTLTNAPPPDPKARSPLPPKVGGPGRTLGGSNNNTSNSNTTSDGAQTSQNQQSPKEAAARAAEVRPLSSPTPQKPERYTDLRIEQQRAAKASAAQPKGKLGKQLEAQKAQTQTGTLAQSARENVAHREADRMAKERGYD